MKPRAIVLLATYNGANYLREQIESILKQSVHDILIFIRDDGSSDETVAIVEWAVSNWPNIVVRVADRLGRLGPVGSFNQLALCALNAADRLGVRYILFSDQDDVWLPNKIEVLLRRLEMIEMQYGSQPSLVHSDLRVVDANLTIIGESLWRYQKINPQRNRLNQLLIQNTVTGCAAAMNVALMRLAVPFPAKCIMHDWWLAMVASQFGRIEPLDDSLVLYRQHGNNNTGAKKLDAIGAILDAVRYWSADDFRRKLTRHVAQAEAFSQQFGARIPKETALMLQDFINLPSGSFIFRKLTPLRRRFLATGMLRNLGLLAKI